MKVQHIKGGKVFFYKALNPWLKALSCTRTRVEQDQSWNHRNLATEMESPDTEKQISTEKYAHISGYVVHGSSGRALPHCLLRLLTPFAEDSIQVTVLCSVRASFIQHQTISGQFVPPIKETAAKLPMSTPEEFHQFLPYQLMFNFPIKLIHSGMSHPGRLPH